MSTAPVNAVASTPRNLTVAAALLVLLAELLLPAGHPVATGGLIALIGAVLFYLPSSHAPAPRGRQLLLSTFAGILLAVVMHLLAWDVWAAALMPTLFQALLALLVARTLGKGKTPFIHRIGAAMQPDGRPLPPDVAIYARRSTWIWLGIFCVLALCNLLTVLSAWPEPAAPIALGLLDLGIAGGAVLLEYFYRRWRFAEHNTHTLTEFCRGLLRLNPLDILLS